MASNDHSALINHDESKASKLGMWLFLYTEVLFFGGLFLLFAIYMAEYREAWAEGGHHMSLPLGTINSIALLTSSALVTMAITALIKNNKKLCINLIYATIALAVVFLMIKYLEWSDHLSHDLYPQSDYMAKLPDGSATFYALYYVMTGLHAVHVIIGIGVLALTAYLIKIDKITSSRIMFLENTVLYWHIVDLVWIFLFPLFYLIA